MSDEDKIRNMNNMNYDNIPKERLISIHKDTLESHRKLRERIDKAIHLLEPIEDSPFTNWVGLKEDLLNILIRGDKE